VKYVEYIDVKSNNYTVCMDKPMRFHDWDDGWVLQGGAGLVITCKRGGDRVLKWEGVIRTGDGPVKILPPGESVRK